jgi:hypothetical protein
MDEKRQEVLSVWRDEEEANVYPEKYRINTCKYL